MAIQTQRLRHQIVRLQKPHKAFAMGKYPSRDWRVNEQKLGRRKVEKDHGVKDGHSPL